jgi:CelD/BcsL family acetyltransferase involved in cellulose biosynthesis
MLRVEPLAGWSGAHDEWTALAARAGSPFAFPEWSAAWFSQLGEGSPLPLACRREDGSIAAILPLYRSGPGLRLAGHGESDELGPVCAPEDRGAAWAALRSWLTEADWQTLVLDDIPAVEHEVLGPGTRLVRRMASPSVDLAGGFEAWLGGRSPGFRSQLRRRRRRLERDHAVAYRVCEDPERLGRDLDTLFALHHARWGGVSGSFDEPRRRLHREFAAFALRRDMLRLRLLELDGRPAAALYNFSAGACEWYYQAGRDPAFDRYAVGFLLQVHAIREAAAEGAGEYRLLRGGEPYKDRFATHSRDVVTLRLDNEPRSRPPADG